MMAGSASINPLLFVAALLLIFAWKTAGFLGLDYFLLNWLGTPWGRRRRAARPESLRREPASAPSSGD